MTFTTDLTTTTSSTRRAPRRVLGSLAVGATAALVVSGCASPETTPPADEQGGTPTSPATPTPATEESPGAATESPTAATAEPLAVTDPWVRAVDQEADQEADEEATEDTMMAMTSVFGELTNTTEEDVQIVDAESPASEDVELHETVEDGGGGTQMQEVEGGFTIPADDTLDLVPGGDHLMLMGLHEPIEPGEEVEVTVELSDGQTQTMTAVARDYAGGNETYEGAHEGTDEDTDAGTPESTDGAGDGGH